MDDSKNNENEKKSGPETSSVAPGAKEYAPPVEGMDYIDRNHMTKASRLRERLMDQMFSKFADNSNQSYRQTACIIAVKTLNFL